MKKLKIFSALAPKKTAQNAPISFAPTAAPPNARNAAWKQPAANQKLPDNLFIKPGNVFSLVIKGALKIFAVATINRSCISKLLGNKTHSFTKAKSTG